MRILLYNPDNGVTRNFMPHLWMFLLQALTPPGHEVLLIDGNAQPMDEDSIARFVREQNIGLVGIGAMTRMIAKAYRIADAIRAVGAEHCIMSTDFGQISNPPPVEGMRMYIETMLQCGISEDEIITMVRKNPAQALGLPAA